MLKKRLISLGIATVFTVSSLTVPVAAADFSLIAKDKKVEIKINPGKGNSNGNKKSWNKVEFFDLDDVSWALNAIRKVAAKGILNGIGQNKFAPKGNVTQLEAIASVLKLTGDNDLAQSYDKKVHPLYTGAKPVWGLGYIYLAIEKKIILPEELKNFKPNEPVKRHEMAKYVIRALGMTEEALNYKDKNLSFNDKKSVPKDSIGYVYLIDKLGIMTGSNGNFRPMAALSRAELAVILDRADSIDSLPDTESRKNNIVFLSYDEDDNKIKVQKNNTTYTYDVVEDVPVYKDSDFTDIYDLVKGDVLQLVFNKDKQVILIEVMKSNAYNDDNDYEQEISIAEVSYNSLPNKVQQQIDNFKSSENYKAYKYNGYIYLFASMGKKNTGGYSIEIDDVFKVKNSDNKYTIKAVVETDSPSSRQIVTQAITYPYTVVRFKEFSNIKNVLFVDEDGDKLKDVRIIDLGTTEDEEESLLDYEELDYEDLPEQLKVQVDYLKQNANYKAYEYDDSIYLIAAMGKKNTGGYEIDITDLYKTEYTNGNYIIKAVVDTDTPSSGQIVTQAITYPYTVVRFDYFDDIEKVRFVDENNKKLAEVNIVRIDEKVAAEGTIYSVTESSRMLKVQKSNGSVVSFTVPDAAVIYVNGEIEDFKDLKKDMKVKVETIDGRVAKVIAEDEYAELIGILTGISIGTNEKKIAVKFGSTYKTYTVASSVRIIIDDNKAKLEDLTVNSEVILKFSNGLLIEIEKH